MCGHSEIFKVSIRECLPNEKNTHWSWWSNKGQEFLFTNYSKLGVAMCFPYGYKIVEEEGKGLLLPVIVELIKG